MIKLFSPFKREFHEVELKVEFKKLLNCFSNKLTLYFNSVKLTVVFSTLFSEDNILNFSNLKLFTLSLISFNDLSKIFFISFDKLLINLIILLSPPETILFKSFPSTFFLTILEICSKFKLFKTPITLVTSSFFKLL